MRVPRSVFSRRSLMLGLLLSGALLGSALNEPRARSGGIDGYSGNPATNGGSICNACHSGGQTPTVALDGPTLVEPDSESTYTLTITGGQETAGGLDVSATSGTLVVVDPATYLRNGEITHNDPRSVDGDGAVVFSFNWRAPAGEGVATLYGAGNSVNLAQGNGGDFPSSDVLTIIVEGGASSPGEASGDSLAPLLVTARDAVTGDLSLGYETGCESTGANVYYGPLSAVSTHGWTGETCATGTGGSVSGFNPGSGSFFFVVVGNKGGDEGSYGLGRQSGVASERPAYPENACGQQQTLADRCD
jgi:hypothetical protein